MAVSEGAKTVPEACLSSDLDNQTDQTPSDSSDIKLRDVSIRSYFKNLLISYVNATVFRLMSNVLW